MHACLWLWLWQQRLAVWLAGWLAGWAAQHGAGHATHARSSSRVHCAALHRTALHCTALLNTCQTPQLPARRLACPVQRRRGSRADPVTEDDLLRAIERLAGLGSGFGVVKIGARQFVRSMPTELSTDSNVLIELAEVRMDVFMCV
jgi:hypothetical protein